MNNHLNLKKYIQITAGRGPVECARVVTLVTQKLLEAIPSAELVDYEPHDSADDCYMSVTLATNDALPQATIDEWKGTVLWRSTKNRYRPGHKRSNWYVGINFSMKWNFHTSIMPTYNMTRAVQAAKGVRV